MSYFAEKIILITGGASGIGYAVAEYFVRQNSIIIIADINEPQGTQAAKQLSTDGTVVFIPTDVRSNTAVQQLLNSIIKKYQKLDFACNSAGIMQPYKNCHEYGEEAWDDVIDTNLKGVWLCMKYQIQAMQNQGGSIVNIASTYGQRGGSVDYAYVASKHGIVGLTKSLAFDHAKDHIRINTISPGAIDTPMFNLPSWNEKDLSTKLGAVPMKRLGTPKEIAAAVGWLCSPEASFITGINLVADGGLLTY